MTDFDPTLVQQIFDISKRKRKPNIEQYRKADDLWTGLEVAKKIGFGHFMRLRNRNASLKPVPSDSAPSFDWSSALAFKPN